MLLFLAKIFHMKDIYFVILDLQVICRYYLAQQDGLLCSSFLEILGISEDTQKKQTQTFWNFWSTAWSVYKVYLDTAVT